MTKANKPPKIGLALGSGAARGLVHIGVLKAMEEYGIKPDYISGCSMGALIGAAYASGMSVKEIEAEALKVNWKLMAKLFSPAISISSFISTDYMSKFLESLFADKTFDDLQIPFSSVATDINTGELVILGKGSLTKAIRASISIPAIFSPVVIGRHSLVDGGLVDPTPVDVLRKKKMDKIIAVNLRKFKTYGLEKPEVRRSPKIKDKKSGNSFNDLFQSLIKNPLEYLNGKETKTIQNPKFWEAIYQSFIIVQVQIGNLAMEIHKPDILIEPDTSKYKVFEFDKAKELITEGYKTAKVQLRQFELIK
jgi:NTE family protein